MATAYTEFDVFSTSLMASLQTAILASSDWSRPNSGTFPTLYKATTDSGVQMCIDLNTTAIDTQHMTCTVYRTHDGTTAGASMGSRYVYWKQGGGGTTATNMVHGVVSAGKNHLFIGLEGPRISEANTDNTNYGSLRSYLFFSALVPYYTVPTEDLVQTVIFHANPFPGSSDYNTGAHLAWASRNGRDNANWTPGALATLNQPTAMASSNIGYHHLQRVAMLDPADKYVVSPFVYFDNAEGMRGRLTSFFYGGHAYLSLTESFAPPPIGQIITIDSVPYKLLSVNRSAQNGSWHNYGAFGIAANNGIAAASPVVAVPWA